MVHQIYEIQIKRYARNISLAGSWKYLPVAEYKSGSFMYSNRTKQLHNSRPVLPVDIFLLILQQHCTMQ